MTRVVLHVGAPKSGTTAVQGRLRRNRAALAGHGVHVPRTDEAGPAALAFRAALDLTGVGLGRGAGFSAGWWPRLVATAAGLDGTVVVSDEGLARAEDDHARRALADLHGAGLDVVVLMTARDLGRQVVSGWLEGLKHGTSTRFGEYLEQARRGEVGALRTYDVPEVLGRWRAAGADDVRLVTLPRPGAGADVLWSRFAAAAGFDPAWAPRPPRRTNDAVGLDEAQVLRALHERLGRATRRGRPLHALVQDAVVPALARRDGPRVELAPAHHGWVHDRASAWAAWVREQEVEVVGDVDDLLPAAPDPRTWLDPDEPRAEALDAAVAALARVLREADRRSGTS